MSASGKIPISNQQIVIFLHIPKTAGTTLYQIVNRHYQKKDIYTIWQDGTLDEFKNLDNSRKSQIRLLRGHAGFGMDKYLPKPAVYFTLLREPIERTISYYHFVRRTPAHYSYEQVTSGDMSLGEFIESRIDRMLDNGQTRLLAGLETGHELAFGECTEELLEIAKRNLRENMAVVGLTEEFDATLLLLKRAFGWHRLFYTRENVSSKRLREAELQTTLNTIIETNQLDIELYQYATTLFEEQIHQQGDQFINQVKSFQKTNRLLAPFVSLRLGIRRTSSAVYWRIRSTSLSELTRKLLHRAFR